MNAKHFQDKKVLKRVCPKIAKQKWPPADMVIVASMIKVFFQCTTTLYIECCKKLVVMVVAVPGVFEYVYVYLHILHYTILSI